MNTNVARVHPLMKLAPGIRIVGFRHLRIRFITQYLVTNVRTIDKFNNIETGDCGETIDNITFLDLG